MFLLKYIVNLSVFSIFVIIPLVIHSFFNYKPVNKVRFWVGLYAGIFTIIFVVLSIKQLGYSLDLRFAPVIIVFAYLGPVAGLITGAIPLLARLYIGGNWYPDVLGWTFVMLCFIIMHLYISRITPIKRVLILSGIYVSIYIIFVSIFHKIKGNPSVHLEYLLFVVLGVIIATFLIESYVKLYRLNSKLSSMYKKVEESEANYRLITENTLDLIVVMDNENFIRYFSPSHKFVLGYEESEMEGNKFSAFIHPDDVCTVRNTLNGLFENQESQSFEFRFQHKNGDWIDVESRCMPVLGEDNSIEHIVIISRDITARKKSEELLLQSEKLAIVGELAAGVAHEIRNPLTTIKGFVQLYKKEHNSEEYCDLLLSEMERIEMITSELLSLGKPQATHLNRMNIRELIENTLDLLSLQGIMNDIQFILSVEESPIFITCEKNQLKQVFLNVIKNAIEAMNNSGKIHINIRKSADGKCIISFQDQGCGIPEELLPRLGEPFYTLKEKGTGLGLMICHKIIKQHKGSITYQSIVNEGTLIEISIPLAI
ncbi:ATP-binding protein [Bacillus sp. AFS031507]|uniref:ATP-binding protein n=1 Tax=Bacillus sp. AFS031507 TaxID=2033496 RepID=UPI000BFB27F8|nr:ATP-binding protein [Bacillus sp. AFS031507]PGY12948.1 PAS domain-containing sensor histidine kinase [Bacillus sp. AFS031507]